eukprot:TRINITY_DN20004_c0_g1_i1.p1 TRINITY_DN20004_c0_g1~~TRINITY_DN20004_c0_g1_i1.p1  ORF type:complete len:339 (-),score=32.87 TRINITY_DN20004_c0_g1_i1:192-1208(-)
MALNLQERIATLQREVERNRHTIRLINIRCTSVKYVGCPHDIQNRSCSVMSLTAQPNADRFASCGMDKCIVLWRLSSCEKTHRLRGHSGDVLSISSKDDLLVSGGTDKTLSLWDFTNGTTLAQIQNAHATAIYSVKAISPTRIATGSADRLMKIWDIPTKTAINSFKHRGSVSAIDSLTTKLIVSACFDKTVQLWDVSSGKAAFNFEGHKDSVTSLQTESDYTVWSGSKDGTIRMWDARKNACIYSFPAGRGWINSISRITECVMVSGGEDGFVRVWNGRTGESLRVFDSHCERKRRRQLDPVNAVEATERGFLVGANIVASYRLLWLRSGSKTQYAG